MLVVAESEHEDRRPASRQVADDLLRRIDAGEYPPESALPTYRQLAADYDVAVNTALAAVRLVRDDGAVTIRRNAGAKVRDRTADTDFSAELNAARNDVVELRSTVEDLSAELAKLEARLSDLSERANTDEST